MSEEQGLLMEFRHKFESALRQPSRMLLVKDLMVTFDPSTLYGKREGFLKALMVTALRTNWQNSCCVICARNIFFFF